VTPCLFASYWDSHYVLCVFSSLVIRISELSHCAYLIFIFRPGQAASAAANGVTIPPAPMMAQANSAQGN